ncbi:MAG: recombinase family protein [Spirochaetales bacterium]|nr:recombinase family protein [Spirochaetales bacterium]
MARHKSATGGPNQVRRVAFYVWVSTEGQARVVEGSLKNQEQMLASELRRRNTGQNWGRLVGSYVDGGFSGSSIDRPEFKRLLADVERGTIDAIFFTELSRLSRSLKDFLNIFEFTQQHKCDLVCLKTEIDTTSPFSNLVVRILMVFAEFERDMTADRIRRNAYERSKRGLAYGGFEPLGYKRDPEHKGKLLVDPEEARIVRDIFQTYLRKRSLLESLKALKKKYEHPRIQKLSRNGIYGILTNRMYIGIREIKTTNGSEEVPGKWTAIVTDKTFGQVRDILSGNGPGPRTPRHNYIFSGLIHCARCGKKLQGKSGKGRSGQARYYYAHPGRCTEGGLHSIEAEDAHKLVEGWLTRMYKDKEYFHELLGIGKEELSKKLRALKSSLKRLDHEDAALRKKLHNATTQSLLKEGPATKALAEKDAEQLLARLQENERQSEEQKSQAESLAAILSSGDDALFRLYADQLSKYLKSPPSQKCRRIFELVRTLTLGEEGLHIELVHPNGSRSSYIDQTAILLRDRIPLPGILLLKSKGFLKRLYHDEGLSTNAIARRIGVGQSTVSDAIQKHGLAKKTEDYAKRPQHVPFGYEYKGGKYVSNPKEQQTIRMIRQLRNAGMTLRDIAAHLNRKLVPTKRGGVWEPGMLQRLLNKPKASDR